MGEDADEFDNEIVTDNLGNVRPVGPKDEVCLTDDKSTNMHFFLHREL